MCMRVTEEILSIVEIEDRYIRNDGRTADIYKQKISIDITCVGLASARPNYMVCVGGPYCMKHYTHSHPHMHTHEGAFAKTTISNIDPR